MFSNYRRFFVLTQFRMISIFFVYFFLFRNAELFSPKYTKLFAAQKFVLSIHNRRRIDERNLYTQWVELRLENAHNCFYFSVISSTCKVWLNRCVINMLVLYMVCVWDGRCILPWNSIHWVCRLLYFTLSHILSLSIAFDLCVRCTVCICVIGIVRRLCTCIDTILFFHFGVYTDSQSEWARERERDGQSFIECMWRKQNITQYEMYSTCDGTVHKCTHKFTMQLLLDREIFIMKESLDKSVRLAKQRKCQNQATENSKLTEQQWFNK